MRAPLFRITAAAVLAACIMSGMGCYYPAYGPASYQAPVSSDSKGEYAPEPSYPPGPPPPRYVAVDPALLVAGAAAAGLLGYAIGHNHGHHYYGPSPYYGGYYGPRYCR